jgi:ATP-binding cassette subfamily F protein uup
VARRKPPSPSALPPEPAGAPRKLSYKEQRARAAEQRELAELPDRIEALEAEQQRLSAAMSSAEFYARDSDAISQDVERAQALDAELAQAYARWEELEGKEVGGS